MDRGKWNRDAAADSGASLMSSRIGKHHRLSTSQRIPAGKKCISGGHQHVLGTSTAKGGSIKVNWAQSTARLQEIAGS